jgi:tetratricopeptide (TPR) repeat protein
MDGRVLTAIYEQPPRTEYIDSWDDVPGDDGRHPPDLQADPIDSTEALKQLVDLGYIEDLGEDVREAVDSTVRELRYNLARAYVDGGQLTEAAGLFRELWDRWPRESRFGVHLLQTQLDQGLPTEARQSFELLKQRKREAAEWAVGEIQAELERLQREFPLQDPGDRVKAEEFAVPDLAAAPPRAGRETPQTPDLDEAPGEVAPGETKPGPESIDWQRVPEQRRRQLSKLRRVSTINLPAMAYLEGGVLQAEGRWDEALRRLHEASGVQLRNRPSLLLKMAELELQRRRWDAATKQFQAVLDLDPLSPAAHLGLARVASHRGDWATVARAAQTCIGQNFHNARAHYLVGMALARLDQPAPAIESLRQAVTIAPLLAAAHRELARVLRQRGDAEGARRHRELAREAQRWRGISAAEATAQGVHPGELREVFEAGELLGAGGARKVELPPREETVVVVTGLPRSGTSMMMQMLQAGGVPVYVDDHRPADESNPKGYLEHERARKLATDHTWLGEAQGKGVKIVAQLLPHLSKQYKYRLVMMHRPLPEIIASQKKLLARLGREGGQITDEALQKTYLQQVRQVRALLSHHQQKGMLDVLDVKYHDVLRDPQGVARDLATFLGGDFDPQKAAWAVDPTLLHERG